MPHSQLALVSSTWRCSPPLQQVPIWIWVSNSGTACSNGLQSNWLNSPFKNLNPILKYHLLKRWRWRCATCENCQIRTSSCISSDAPEYVTTGVLYKKIKSESLEIKLGTLLSLSLSPLPLSKINHVWQQEESVDRMEYGDSERMMVSVTTGLSEIQIPSRGIPAIVCTGG